jgi:hypothetical protein
MYLASFEATMPLGALINELRADAKTDTGSAATETVALRIYTDADLSDDAVAMLRQFGTVTHKNYRDGDMLEGDVYDRPHSNTTICLLPRWISWTRQSSRTAEPANDRGMPRKPDHVDIEACTSAGIRGLFTPPAATRTAWRT